MSTASPPRDDEAVLHQPILEAQLAEGVRSKKAFEARADGGECQGSRRARANMLKDEIVAERLESLGIFERGSLRRSLFLHHFQSRFEGLQTLEFWIRSHFGRYFVSAKNPREA